MRVLWLFVMVWIPVLILGVGCSKSQEKEKGEMEKAFERAARKGPRGEVRETTKAVRKEGSGMLQDTTLDTRP